MPNRRQTIIRLIGRYRPLREDEIISIYLVAPPYKKPIIIEVKGDEAEIVDTNSDQGVHCTPEVKLVRKALREHKIHGAIHVSGDSAKGYIEVVTQATIADRARRHPAGAGYRGDDDGDADCDCNGGD